MTPPIDDAFIWSSLTKIFREAFSRDDLLLNAEMTAADIDGWDSFRHVEILVAVQVEFGLHMSSREIDQLHSVGDLARLVASKTTKP